MDDKYNKLVQYIKHKSDTYKEWIDKRDNAGEYHHLYLSGMNAFTNELLQYIDDLNGELPKT